MKLKIHQILSCAALLVSAHALYLDESPIDSNGLFARQDTGPAGCAPPSCEIETCGSACSLPRKRALGSGLTSRNVNSTGSIASLERRVFKIKPGDTGPATGRLLVKDINAYVHDTVEGERWDTQYGDMGYFFAGDERAVSLQARFGNEPFQWGQNALKGCTQIILISKRAAWMAHFWESYSLGKPNTDGPRGNIGYTAFEQRVLNHLTGTPVRNPDPGYYPKGLKDYPDNKDRPYLPPDGPSIDRTLFTEDDDVQLIIMSRAREQDRPSDKEKKFRYPQRMQLITDTISAHLGIRRLRVIEYPYASTLDYKLTEAQIAAKSARGKILFQYDPSSDGGSTRSWRVFTEDRYIPGKVVPYL